MARDPWFGYTAYGSTGLRPTAPRREGAVSGATAVAASTDPHGLIGSKPWHPDSPLFWAGALLAATVGLVAASSSVRVGPVRASVSAGKS